MSRENDRVAVWAKELRDAARAQEASRDPFGSHDGMDIDPHTAVVETCGYGFRNEVAENVREAFLEDLEDDRQINQIRQDESKFPVLSVVVGEQVLACLDVHHHAQELCMLHKHVQHY